MIWAKRLRLKPDRRMQMAWERNRVTVAALGASLVYAAYAYGGMDEQAWNACLLVIGASATVYWLTLGRSHARATDRWLLWCAASIPAYVALQLIPVPHEVLDFVSPARSQALADLNAAVSTPVGWAPLSVAPAATAKYLARTLGFLAVFVTVREIGVRSQRPCWVLAAPLLVVSGLEAVWAAMEMSFSSESPHTAGTYVNRNHFAGLLEVCAPFAVAYAIAAWHRGSGHGAVSVGGALKAGLGLAVFALLISASQLSLSRAGFTGTVLAGTLVGALWFSGRDSKRRGFCTRAVVTGSAFGFVAVVAFFLLPGESLIERFASLIETENLDLPTRVGFWRDAWAVFQAYPLFGCGMGGYFSAVPAVKSAGLEYGMDYAHNDYLQLLAELGIAGFLAGAVFMVHIGRSLWRNGLSSSRPERQLLAIAAASAMVVAALHSLVDFNVYIPANAMTFAWVLGIAAIPKPRLAPIELIETGSRAEVVEIHAVAVL